MRINWKTILDKEHIPILYIIIECQSLQFGITSMWCIHCVEDNISSTLRVLFILQLCSIIYLLGEHVLRRKMCIAQKCSYLIVVIGIKLFSNAGILSAAQLKQLRLIAKVDVLNRT